MATTEFPLRYEDPEYQKAHRSIFGNTLQAPLVQVLPPDISQEDFDAAIDEFVEAIGKESVFAGQALEEYVDPYELWEVEGKRKVPSAALCPSSNEELQKVLKIANKYSIPVWTFSRGKNLGYGGPAPRLTGSIALDLHRMNKIIEVSENFAYAVVEPGVTFTDLYNHCIQNKLGVWPSTPSLGWGSVVGNTLDRGTGFTPTATHHQNIAGLEVVLADGDIVRTGQFAISNSPSAHLSKFTFGPSIEGLFIQSNLGIVTKMGIWLHPQPQAYMSCSFAMPAIEDIVLMADTFGALRRDGLLPNTVYISNITEWAGVMAQRASYWNGEGCIPDWRMKEIQEKLGFGYWNAKFGLYGAKDVIESHFNELKRILAKKFPTGELRGQVFSGANDELLDAMNVPEPHGGMFVGVPSLWSLPMVKYRLPPDGSGVGAHADYSPIIPSSGKLILEWVKEAKEIYESEGFELFCDFFMHERHIIFVCMMVFDKSKAEERRTVDRIYQKLFAAGSKRGFSNYRSHINYMDEVSDLYDFNDHAYRRFVERLKDTLDPNGILSPGKQGIWPKRFRKDENGGQRSLPA